MKYVCIPDKMVRRLPFYLAMEEYLAQNIGDEELFFMWQVEPTVIIGRNQIIEQEVDLAYCADNGIAVYRRKSGGGCVYADRNNIMFSYVTPDSSPVSVTFGHYTAMVARMLAGLGLDASDNSRNDILIGERKVSGNAFYHIPGCSIVHGTMLYDTDPAHMSAAITPPAAKLESRGVKSVRSRITTLKEHIAMGIDEFKDYARRELCDGEICLDLNGVAEIENLSAPYYERDWIYGRKRGHFSRNRRIDGVGDFSIDLATTSDGLIADVDLSGDFFLLSDMDSMLINPLRSVKYDRESVAEALKYVTTENVIHGLTREQFMDLLF